MEQLDFAQLTEEERVAIYGALFAMAVADGSLDDDELVNIFECLDLTDMSDAAVRIVRGYLLEPPELEHALTPLQQSDNDVRYAALVHLMDVALADSIYAPGEKAAILKAGEILGAHDDQIEVIEAFIREVRGLADSGVDVDSARDRLAAAGARVEEAGVPKRSLALSGSVAAASAGGVGAAAIAGLGLALAPGIGLALASGTAAYFAMRLLTGANHEDEPDQAEIERVIDHLQHAIEAGHERMASLELVTTGTRDEQTARREQVKRINNQIRGLERLLARKRGELR